MTKQNTTTPTITHVEITQDAELGWCVHPVWSGVDRPDTGGWAVTNKRLAERLRAALLAGVVYSNIEVCTDVNGKTFVNGISRVMARKANADLCRLGF
jgi:hypothetical protein